MQPNIPRIPVKIIRKNGNIKITIRTHSIELKPLEGYEQSYDLVTLEQFITKRAMAEYSAIVSSEKRKKNIRKAFLEASEEDQDNKIVEQMLKETFGEDK